MLLQQSLMLQAAADAIEDARWSAGRRPENVRRDRPGARPERDELSVAMVADRAGAGLECGTRLEPLATRAGRMDRRSLRRDPPALSPNRTMGSLGGLVASRIAREFRIGGPSFTVSSDENSGLDALRLAADWLARGEVDSAVVGAVDLAGDVRTARAARLLHDPEHLRVGEGATALVLKRMADAVRDGDRVYAVIGDPSQVESSAVLLDSVRNAIGWTGAAEGLASIAAAAVALETAVLPPSSGEDGAIGPRYWLRNRDDGPRVALVRQRSLGGVDQAVALESVDAPTRTDRRQPLGPHPRAIFAVGGSDPVERDERLAKLERLAWEDPTRPIETLARLWRQAERDETAPSVVALIAGASGALARTIRAIRDDLANDRPIDRSTTEDAGVEVFTPRRDWDVPPRVALTYPGLGNVFAGMGSRISALWPELLDELEDRFATVRDQFAPDVWWNGPLPSRYDDHRPAILGQIAVGSLTTSLFRKLGVKPGAALGYSLGESAALVALGAWPDRDDMFTAADGVASVRHRACRPLLDRPSGVGAWRVGAGRLGRGNRAAIGRRGRGGDRRRRSRLRLDPQRERRNRGRRTGGRRARRLADPAVPVPAAPSGEHGPLRGRPERRARVSGAPRSADRAGRGRLVLQRRVGNGLRARPRNRRRRDHGAGGACDRLPARGRESVRRRDSRVPRNGPRLVLHEADRPHPRRSPPRGRLGLPGRRRRPERGPSRLSAS